MLIFQGLNYTIVNHRHWQLSCFGSQAGFLVANDYD